MTTKEEFKEFIAKLDERHKQVKQEMIQILEASKLLDEQYKTLEMELYSLESQYADTIKKMID